MIYVDVTQDYTFYYNVNKEINRAVVNVIGEELSKRVPRTSNGESYGVLGAYDNKTQTNEYVNTSLVGGITALVSKKLAEAILERAKYYCPVDTGKLKNSGRIEEIDEYTSRIFFDCEYAWYTHELTYHKHAYPTQAKFLSVAVNEVMTSWGN